MTERVRQPPAAKRPRVAAKKPPREEVEVEDDDEEDDDEEAEAGSLGGIPDGYSLIKDTVLESLVAGQRVTSEQLNAVAAGNHKLEEARFIGTQGMIGAQGDELRATYAHLGLSQEKISKLQDEIHLKNMELADARRASEEANLAREELKASVENQRTALRSKQLELDNDRAKLRDTLTFISPLMEGGKMAIAELGKEFVAKKFRPQGAPGLPSGPAPVGANGTPSAPDARPSVEMSDEGLREWHALVHGGFAKLNVESAKYLRALIASALSRAMGNADAPTIEFTTVMGQLQTNLGDEFVIDFIRETSRAWAEVKPAPQQTNGAVITPPSNNAAN